jgi:hypothetical protein
MGHLPPSASLEEYNQIITTLLQMPENVVYYYPFGQSSFYAVSGRIGATIWVVIFNPDGVMETAFPPTDPDGYIARRGFQVIGSIGEVME